MNRRNLLKLGVTGAVGLQLAACNVFSGSNENSAGVAKQKSFPGTPIKPKALKPGDTVGVVAPGTNAQDVETIAKVKEVLEELELKPVITDTLRSEFGYKTRSPQVRADELNKMFASNDIDGIFCIRGGYGCQQILNLLDYDMIARNPKVFAGYSDITALLLTISSRCNFITFHAPVMSSAFTSYTTSHFKEMLFGEAGEGTILKNPDSKSGLRSSYPVRTVTPGKAKGRLIGGNLSLISALMGTPFEIDTTDKILFIEDIGEQPYSIDRMLSQLQLAGKFDNVRGIVFGKCEGCSGGSSTWDRTLGEVIDFYLKPLGVPVFYGLLFGHSSNQLTIPELCKAEIDADVGSIELKEKAVV
jgi:muramoyltetrapeptide carboxypeptidase